MTVAAKSPLELYDGDGVTTAFSARWRYLDTVHLLVEIISSEGVATVLAPGVDYSATAGLTDAGGVVTLVTAPAVGETVRIRRNTPQAQSAQYPTSGAFPAKSHELALDRTMMAVQELGREQADFHARALMLPFGESATGLPKASERASRFLAFGPSGLPFMSQGTGVDAGLREDLAAPTGGGLLTIQVEGVGAKPQPIIEHLKNAGMKTPQDFSARGPGYDDTAHIHDWLSAVADYRGGGLLLPMEYSIDEALDMTAKDFSGCTLFGLKKRSIIKGTNGIGQVMMHLPSCAGFTMDGIGLVSEHVEAVRDYRGLLTVENKSLINVKLRNLYFSAESNHTQAFFICTVTNPALPLGQRGQIDELELDRIMIDGIGGQGGTIMNRAYDEVGGHGRMRRVWVNRPEMRRTGLMGTPGTDNGLGLSLDGLGLDALVNNGLFEDLGPGIGIENTGFIYTTIRDNIGRNFTRGWTLIGWHGFPYSAGDTTGNVRVFSHCHSLRNRMVGPLTGATVADYGCMDSTCTVEGDYVGSTALTAVSMKFMNKPKIKKCEFIAAAATSTSAILMDASDYTSSGNPPVANYCTKIDFEDCVADMSASTVGGNALSFIGANATGSTFRGEKAEVKKGSISGYVGQASGASGNTLAPFIDETGARRNTVLTLSASGDADETISSGISAQRFELLLFSGGTAWTAERKLNFPSIEQFRNGCQFRHTKEWPCTLQIAGVDVASSRVTPNQTVSLRANNSGTLIVTPLTTASLRGSKSYDAPSIPAGQSITTTVTVNGAATTDWASASLSVSPQGMTVQANISANNLSLVSIFNGTAGAIDLATATLSSWAQR